MVLANGATTGGRLMSCTAFVGAAAITDGGTAGGVGRAAATGDADARKAGGADGATPLSPFLVSAPSLSTSSSTPPRLSLRLVRGSVMWAVVTACATAAGIDWEYLATPYTAPPSMATEAAGVAFRAAERASPPAVTSAAEPAEGATQARAVAASCLRARDGREQPITKKHAKYCENDGKYENRVRLHKNPLSSSATDRYDSTHGAWPTLYMMGMSAQQCESGQEPQPPSRALQSRLRRV